MAGAGYKLFNTGDVLTAAQVNTYLMEQTVMVFADAAARTTALTGVVSEGMISYLKDTNATEVYNGSAWVGITGDGDITGVTAGTGISGGGTSGDVTITNSMATAIDAKGDLIVGTGADTFAKLTVGANDLLVTADSGETTGLKYTGGWTTWTPTIFNFTLGNGTLTARYSKLGKTVNYYLRVVFGSTTSFSGNPTFTLPITPSYQEGPVGNIFIDDPGSAGYIGLAIMFGGNPYLSVGRSDATFLKYELFSATVPMTWGNNDTLTIRGSYEVA